MLLWKRCKLPLSVCCPSWYLKIWLTLFEHGFDKDGGKQWQPEFSLSNGVALL